MTSRLVRVACARNRSRYHTRAHHDHPHVVRIRTSSAYARIAVVNLYMRGASFRLSAERLFFSQTHVRCCHFAISELSYFSLRFLAQLSRCLSLIFYCACFLTSPTGELFLYELMKIRDPSKKNSVSSFGKMNIFLSLNFSLNILFIFTQ